MGEEIDLEEIKEYLNTKIPRSDGYSYFISIKNKKEEPDKVIDMWSNE